MTTPLSPEHPLLQVPGLWHPTAPRRGAVVLFRHVLRIRRAVRGLRLAISACHRYELRLDGALLGRGPARSDPRHWGARTVTLPPLAAGRHVFAVVVAHDGDGAGESQLGDGGFLVIAGLGAAAALLPAEGWLTWHDQAVGPCDEQGWGAGRAPYAPVGSHERFIAGRHPWGWQRTAFRATGWLPARRLRQAGDRWGNLALGVQLCAEPLPPMTETPLAVRLASGDGAEAWAAGRAALRLPPRTRGRWILDRGASGVHWPTIGWSGGDGAAIRLTWVEAPRDGTGRLTDRDRVDGSDLVGHRDLLLADGGRGRRWQPRWLRSGRYLVIDVRTAAAPLRLEPVTLADTGFPFRRRLRLTADGAWRSLIEVSERTLRSCAHEAIWDCPHYEQCQFPGDARVQAVAHYLLFGDDRLARKALTDLADSQRPDGLLACRAPARSPQRIDTFTLQWVLMLGEFLRWRGDAAFVAGLLPAARHALDPFLARRRDDGLIGGGLMAPFIDWSPAFDAGNAPQDRDGGSAIVALLVAQACATLARLEAAAGWPELAPRWQRCAAQLRAAVRRRCWSHGILWDTPAGRSRSVHAQVEAVHAGLLSGPAARRALASETGAAPIGTRFYRWHLGTAWLGAGAPGRALDLVGGWVRQLATIPGLATWPESDADPRSDCHGWGAYPVFAAAAVLLGVTPAADGMAEAALAPHPGALPAVSGSVPTPHGPIEIEVERRRDGALDVRWTSPVPVRCGRRRYRAGRGAARLG